MHPLRSRSRILGWLLAGSLLASPASPQVATSTGPEAPAPVDESGPGKTGPAEPPLFLGPTLTNGWFGLSPVLEDHGLGFEVVYTGEVWGNVNGGLRRGAKYLDNWDVIFTADTEPLVGLPGGSFQLYLLGNTGGEPSADLFGDAQAVSNIETDRHAIHIYELWYDQRFLDDRVSLRFGLYDLNSEFDVNETGSLFINSSHGIGAEFAQAGLGGPSIFPNTALALRADWRITEQLTWRLAALDGAPDYEGEDPYRPHIDLNDTDGALLVTEVVYQGRVVETDLRTGAGVWGYTSDFSEVAEEDETSAGNVGAYAIVEAELYEESEEQGLSAFFRPGIANQTFNQFEFYLGGGLVYTGLIPTRDSDQLGVAVAAAVAGRDYRRSVRDAGGSTDSAEINFEFTYRAALLPWLVLQPDVQYILDPNVDPEIDDVLALGLRFEVTF